MTRAMRDGRRQNIALLATTTALAVALHRWRSCERKLERESHDGVTGVLTRRAWQEVASRAWRPGAVVGLVDIDDFKGVNDTYGHRAGDEVLYAVAQRLNSALGPDAVVGRYGGDEIVFVARRPVPRRLLNGLAADVPISNRSRPLRIGVSLGFSTPGVQNDLWSAISAADAAMYEVKVPAQRVAA